MSVVARFYVQSVEAPEGSPAATVTLGAVCRGAHNKVWASATPSGQIRMTIRNDQATAQFEQGKEYEVLFREITPPRPGDGHAPQPYRTDWGVFCAECGGYPQNGSKDVSDDELDWTAHHEMFGSS